MATGSRFLISRLLGQQPETQLEVATIALFYVLVLIPHEFAYTVEDVSRFS